MASSFQEYKWRRARLWKLGLTLGEYEQYLASPHWQKLSITVALSEDF
jgi:hypothetical protein